jgi:branched-chain amino acid transport system permease protein
MQTRSTHAKVMMAPNTRWAWAAFACVLAAMPWLFHSSFSITMLSQMGIAIIACLSYNMLLGQGGMLSFGHAVYSGLGAYLAIHAMNLAAAGNLWLPVPLVPLVGGLGGLFFAALFGYVTTKKAGTPFAMITLGMGELVFAMSLMFAEFFGGEAGISGNRVYGRPLLGFTFGPAIEVYYLIAIYTFLCAVAMYGLTQTPLGRILNAVRDNPERVEFIGYDPQRVRYLAFLISGFFAGVAGGLGAVLFEIVTAEVVGAARSGAYLLFTFLGGATFFFGPMLGGVLMVLAFMLLSEWTKAWLLYLGLAFMLMVMFAPGGLASLVMLHVQWIRQGRLAKIAGPYLALILAGVAVFLAAAALIEMVYALQLNAGGEEVLRFLGVELRPRALSNWLACGLALVVSSAWFEWTRRAFLKRWAAVSSAPADEVLPDASATREAH